MIIAVGLIAVIVGFVGGFKFGAYCCAAAIWDNANER